MKIVREIASSRIALEHAGPVPDSIDDFTSVTDGARFMGHPDRADEFSFLLENGARRGGSPSCRTSTLVTRRAP